MTDNHLTLRALLTHLQEQGVTHSDTFEDAETFLKDRTESTLYIDLLIGLGAWASSVCFLLFLGMSDMIPDVSEGRIVMGVVFLGFSLLLHRTTQRLFVAQFALSVSLLSNVLILSGAQSLGWAVILQVIIATILYPFYKDPASRFLKPLLAVALALVWVYEEELTGLLELLIAFEIVATWGLYLWARMPDSLRPLRYAAAVSLLGTLLVMTSNKPMEWGLSTALQWPTSIMLAGGLIVLYIRLAQGYPAAMREWMGLAIGATVLLGALSAPGLLVALGLLLIAYNQDDRLLISMSGLFLVAFLTLFYYSLDLDLASKSLVLIGSGLLLLLVRALLSRRPWAQEVPS